MARTRLGLGSISTARRLEEARREDYRAMLLGDGHRAGGWAERAPNPLDGAPIAVRVIDLAGLDPAEGFMIQGDAPSDFAGFSVSDAGDVNDDGFADVIVGARFGDDGGLNAGEAYVIFGKASGFATIDLATLAAADGFIIQGDIDVSYSSTGFSVSAAGDVDGDGFDDVIVGAPHSDDGGFPKAGEAYVIFGKAGAFGSPDGGGRQVINLSTLTATDGFTILGEDSYDEAGRSVSSAGDVNGDGFADIIVGAHHSEDGGGYASGAAYVLFGKASGFGAVFDLAFTADDDIGFTIDGGYQDSAGWSVAAAGDVNGDGFDDVIVGAPGEATEGPGAGASYVIFGKASGFADLDLTSLAIADGFAILGENGFDNSGSSVSGAGDINGDGFDDIIIGSPETTNPINNGRTAFVVFGKAGGFATVDLAALTPADGFAISYRIGYDGDNITHVSAAGDVDGDGLADIIVGVPSKQEAWVIYGKTGGFGEIELDTLAPADGFVIRGNGLQHDAGFSVSGAGDVNQDGYDDLIVGAPGGDTGGTNAGEAYVIFGGPSGVLLQGSAGANLLIGGEGKDTLAGLGGSDTLRGAEGGDRLEGGSGGDWADYTGAADKVKADLKTPAANTGDAAGDVYVSIEHLRGTSFKDVLLGDDFANRIEGRAKNDNISGRDGNDTLAGGTGKDTLKGGAGADRFELASLAAADADKISDFVAGDKIALDGATYGLAPGALPGNRFVTGTAAGDGNDRLIYNNANGKLFFDPDGTGAQGQVLIATLTGAPALGAGDFVVI